MGVQIGIHARIPNTKSEVFRPKTVLEAQKLAVHFKRNKSISNV